jgi:hypothetical protein
MRLTTVRVLGWLVIAHGLSHAVLPLRGSLSPVFEIGDWMPVALYIVGMIGFVAAGLGMLGLRPLEKVVSPGLVLASGLSLVAIVRFGDPTLWMGGALDAILLVVGLWRGYAGWPAHPSHGRVWHVVGLACGLGFLGYVAVATALWPWHRTWGSTRAELTLSLPGDRPIRHPALEIQHAVTIDVPPERVWPWLLQLGQDRAGFYSYDWLERAFGADVHNVGVILEDWQHRQVGDFVRATQPAYLGGLFGQDLGWTITALEPERAMVLEHWGAFVLQPLEDNRTRFIIRSTVSDPSITVWASALEFLTFELPHFIMERRMMLTIKTLAEHHGNIEALAR